MEAFSFDAMLKSGGMALPALGLMPLLEITNHTSLSEEKVTKFGQTYNVHVVVKNSPFVVTCAMRNSRGHSFNHLAFDISLIYDMPGLDKPVTYVSTKPVDYKPLISDGGDEISFDVKIKVLSSHHEDNFFRLRIEVWDPLEKSGFQPMHVITAPIKVISKPLKPKPAPGAKPPVKKATPNAKRKAQEMIESDDEEDGSAGLPSEIEAHLENLNRQQAETLRLLNLLVESQRGGQLAHAPHAQLGLGGGSGLNLNLGSQPSSSSSSSLFGNNGFSFAPSASNPSQQSSAEPPTKRLKLENPSRQIPPLDGNKDEFEGAFSTMLRSYGAMTAEEKAEKTRKLIRALGSREHEMLEELVDILGTAGLKTNPNSSGATFTAGFHSDQCGEDCAHKEELMRIDQFYNEVFF